MESSRKIVLSIVLIYFIYGLGTVVQYGQFLPPLPLNEVFIGLIATILGVKHFKKSKKLYGYLIFFGVTTLMFSNFFLEIVLNYSTQEAYSKNFDNYTELLKLVLLSVLLIYLSFIRINRTIRFNALPFLVLIGILVGSFLENILITQISFSLFAVVLFIVERQCGNNYEERETYPLELFFVGMGFIHLQDLVANLF